MPERCAISVLVRAHPKNEMEHVKAIQGVVDEHKEQMPTGAVTAIMEHLQKLYDNKSKLYRAQMTHIHSVGFVTDDGAASKTIQYTTTAIVESVAKYPRGIRNHIHLLKSGMCSNIWLERGEFPMVMGGSNNLTTCEEDEEVLILHSLEPLVPESSKKRKASE